MLFVLRSVVCVVRDSCDVGQVNSVSAVSVVVTVEIVLICILYSCFVASWYFWLVACRSCHCSLKSVVVVMVVTMAL